MAISTNVETPAGWNKQVPLSGHVDQCPRCHRGIWEARPVVLKRLATSSRDIECDIEECYVCVICHRFFVVVYRHKACGGEEYEYALSRIVPQEPKPVHVPKMVATLSPIFVETYLQALQADALGLTQLTGIGLRKALEFLVKDFAVSRNADEASTIGKKPLGTCISDYVEDKTVQKVAMRAAWLGNDETHYVRRWEDRDVEDLKVLICLTVNGIDNVLLSQRYIDEIPDPATLKPQS